MIQTSFLSKTLISSIRSFSSSSPPPHYQTLTLPNLLKTALSPTPHSLNDLLTLLFRCRRFSLLLHVFSQMGSNGVSVDSRARSIVARALIEDRRFDEAEDFIDRHKRRGLYDQDLLWSSLIRGVCVYGGNPEKALSLLRDCLSDRAVRLDVVVYSSVVDGLCKKGYLEKALDVCESMRKRGIHPNIVTYNSVINCLCREGCFAEAFRLFDSLKQNNLHPTVITYATLIVALCRRGFIQDAIQLLDRMVLEDLAPNAIIYNSLINGYCRFGLIEEALKLLLDLEKSFGKPDPCTISALINGFCVRGDLEGALVFFNEYERRETSPDFLGYMHMIKGLHARGRLEEARSVLRVMLLNHSVIDLINKAGEEVKVDSLVDLLGLLCQQGSIQEALNILGEVRSIAFPFGGLNDGSVERMDRTSNLNHISCKTVGEESIIKDCDDLMEEPYGRTSIPHIP
ncbi:Pentatricopeptide repeat-containing protein [Acorus calamus]|uniref:Pentatricopeptide repeat-containing protein n=1 Tax=Acorus calamus TaxID=4465 RepID=A0AAV9ETC4_ACOCL|nr:Pentatricopeptide repeat-containing protein [Acorus calamus]